MPEQVWKCEYCGQTYPTRALCKKYEAECPRNPKNERCATCGHLIRGIDRDHLGLVCELTNERKLFVDACNITEMDPSPLPYQDEWMPQNMDRKAVPA